MGWSERRKIKKVLTYQRGTEGRYPFANQDGVQILGKSVINSEKQKGTKFLDQDRENDQQTQATFYQPKQKEVFVLQH